MSITPNSDEISSGLGANCEHVVQIHAFAELPSTSVWLSEHIPSLVGFSDHQREVQQVQSHHLCVADWQTDGIARRGRHWQTQPGNITFSLLSVTSKPAKDLLGLSLVTGIAVADVLKSQLSLDAKLKWPNDVLIQGSKIGGLLTEVKRSPVVGNAIENHAMLTGIGINVLHDNAVADLGIGGTSIESQGRLLSNQQRDQLIGELARSVLDAHKEFLDKGWGAFVTRWNQLDYLANRWVSVHGDSVTGQAKVLGVNDVGALLVEQNGHQLPLYSGNVSIRPSA